MKTDWLKLRQDDLPVLLAIIGIAVVLLIHYWGV